MKLLLIVGAADTLRSRQRNGEKPQKRYGILL